MPAVRLVTDFKTIKEEWTDYNLEDGTIIRLKTLLGYIEREGKNQTINVHHITSIWVPEDKRNVEARETALTVEELEEYVEQRGVKFDPRFQGQSVYKTEQGVLTLETRAIRFHRTSKYDLQGMPQYIIEQEIRTIAQGRPQIPGQRQPKKRPATKKA